MTEVPGYSRSVYPAADEDVMVDEIDGVDCLYACARSPGIPAENFPGARCSSHLSINHGWIPRAGCRHAEGPTSISGDIVDFVAFDGDRFLAGVSRRWNSQSDIKYHLMNLMEIHGLDPAATQVSLSGLREVKTSLMKDLRKRHSLLSCSDPAPVRSRNRYASGGSVAFCGSDGHCGIIDNNIE